MVKAESHQTRGVLTTGALGPGGQDVLRTRILQPLGLTHTIFPTTAAMPSPHLHGYSVQGGPLTEANTATNTSVEWTAGAMISTLDDLHTWAQALATGRCCWLACSVRPERTRACGYPRPTVVPPHATSPKVSA